MKKRVLFISFILISIVSVSQITSGNKFVDEYLNQEKVSQEAIVYQFHPQNKAERVIESVMKETILTLSKEESAFFVDEIPNANWGHPCRYIAVNTKTGTVRTEHRLLPPSNLQLWDMVYGTLPKVDGKCFDFKKLNQSGAKTPPAGLTPDKCYAVIISGGMDPSNNHIRYWNDCQAIYNALTYEYGYLDSHIYVLMSDGTNPAWDRHVSGNTYDSSPLDLDGDGDDDVQYPATKSAISQVFNTLSTIISNDDYLFVYTIDHGTLSETGQVLLCLWGEYMTTTEFNTEINKIHSDDINIVMGQCYSGGFVTPLNNVGRVITTACGANEVSYAHAGAIYDEFVYHWTAAVYGEDPYGNPVNADSNNDGYVTMAEAYNYATIHDVMPEHPDFVSNKSFLGQFTTLLGMQPCNTFNVQNWNITTNTGVLACKVRISNSSVSNGASFRVITASETTITQGFKVELGSTLKIQ